MAKFTIYPWKQFPFIRFLLPLITGILLQFYLQASIAFAVGMFALAIIVLSAFYFFKSVHRYQFGFIAGVAIQAIFISMGATVTFINDTSNHRNWLGKNYRDSAIILVTIQEPTVEKAKSWKAIATVDAIKKDGSWAPTEGKIILYFKKDSLRPQVGYGSQLVLNKPLQKITNSGNPGAFNYQRYCSFQGIYYQVFLMHDNYVIVSNHANLFKKLLFITRSKVIATLKKYIQSPQEVGVAEALLIGYRDDLDKDLVEAYSNTGVVHIIAISGLHLGLIYGVLLWFFKLFRNNRSTVWLQPVVILFVLWMFTFIAGAAPSILRSAIMFTCIVIGKIINRNGSIYNTLAVSAFIILCYNPFYLWDVGFQLSYAAVLSIVIFMKPIYNWFYHHNKLLDKLWQLNAVTISAQILTLPIVLYHFHQYPNYFLLSNLIAVPLSSIILLAELLMIFFSAFTPFVAVYLGKLCTFLLSFMNSFIEWINKMPYAVTDGIQLSLTQSLLLFLVIVFVCYWLMKKFKPAIYYSCATLLLLVISLSHQKYQMMQQQKVVVYNIPQHTAIDIIDGRSFSFIGDTLIDNNNFIQNFHLKPARTFFGIEQTEQAENLQLNYPFVAYQNKKILIIQEPLKFQSVNRIKVDAIVMSKNPRVYIADLLKTFDCNLFVFDASNPAWKIKLWKKDCDDLHLRHYSTAEKGAFVMEL